MDLVLPAHREAALLRAWRAFRGDAGEAPPSSAELTALAQDVLRLQRGLTGSRELAGAGYMDDAGLLGAYLLYYWPVSWAQSARALRLSGMGGRLNGARVLDLGSGPGPMAAAALDLGAASATLMDKSRAALDLAGGLLRGQAAGTVQADLDGAFSIPPGPYDLIVAGHVLNEIAGPNALERRLRLLESVLPSLSRDGAVLVMEPATLDASRSLLALRDNLAARGWRVLAPCTHSEPCPALAAGPQHTCHDQAAWSMPTVVAGLARIAGLDRGLVKASWLALAPPGQATGSRPNAWRVVSEPMLNKAGRVRYLVCGQGRRFPFSAKRGDPAAERAGFFSLSRYDLITVAEPERRESGWGFGPATALRKE